MAWIRPSAGASGVTDALGNTTTTEYDANGYLLSSTDPDGRVTDTVYNAVGQKVSQTWTDASGHVVNTLSWSYYAAGDLLSASSMNGSSQLGYTFTYDANGPRDWQTGSGSGRLAGARKSRGGEALCFEDE